MMMMNYHLFVCKSCSFLRPSNLSLKQKQSCWSNILTRWSALGQSLSHQSYSCFIDNDNKQFLWFLWSSPLHSCTSTSVNQRNYSKSAISTALSIRNNTSHSQFKESPLNPSILQYIKRIGIGMTKQKRPRKKRFNRTRSKQNNDDLDVYYDNEYKQFLSRSEERELFRRKRSRKLQQRQLQSSTFVDDAGKNSRTTAKDTQSSPPPPFGHGKVIRNSYKNNQKSVTNYPYKNNNYEYYPLPVKVLGSVGVSDRYTTNNGTIGCCNDDFPKPTSGIPEVAIIGRSNVGKSTLLNALLYGGRYFNLEQVNCDNEEINNNTQKNNSMLQEQHIRRNKRERRKKNHIGQTAKLPKGIKAATSSKPGETRTITFYQLSAKKNKSLLLEENIIDNDNCEDRRAGEKSRLYHHKQESKSTVSLLLVDLPGYGFAYAPSSLTKSSNLQDNGENDSHLSSAMYDATTPTSTHADPSLLPWQSLIERYILERPRSSLKRILLLIDARHGMKRTDYDFLGSLQRNLLTKKQVQDRRYNENKSLATNREINKDLPPIQIVLTKCDLVAQSDLARRVVQVRKQLSECLFRQPSALPEMLVSAQMEGQLGVPELQKELASLCHQI